MIKKFLWFLAIILIAGGTHYTFVLTSLSFLEKLTESLIWVGVFYLIFGVILEEIAIEKVSDLKTRYSLRKAINYLMVFASVIIVIPVWISDPNKILVSIGVIGAGLAVAFQDLFKNILGTIIVFSSGMVKVGDRVEVNSVKGDIIDIGFLYTSMFELESWVNAEQPTGRIITIPNSIYVKDQIRNYTKDHSFIWDELVIPVTYDSNWKLAVKKIELVLEKQLGKANKIASKELRNLSKKFFIPNKQTEPEIFISMSDQWIGINIRYICLTDERRKVQSDLNSAILQELGKYKSITISNTLGIDILSMPKQ